MTQPSPDYAALMSASDAQLAQAGATPAQIAAIRAGGAPSAPVSPAAADYTTPRGEGWIDPRPNKEQLDAALRAGKLSYQQYMAAAQSVAPSNASNAPDVAAMHAAGPADLRYGSGTGGAVNAPPASPQDASPGPATPKALATVPQAGQGVAAPQGSGIIPYGPGTAATTRAAGMSPADKWLDQTSIGHLAEQTEHIDDAVKEQRDLASEQADRTKLLANQSDVAVAQHREREADLAKKRDGLLTEQKDASARIEAQLADEQAKGVDPNHYWQSQSTGSKILSAIAIGLGTFGSGLAHAPNTALNIINGAIADDIDAQKVNLQRHVELLRMRGQLNENNFDHQQAMLRAEGDSIQTSYAVAINNVTRKAALFGDNEAAQQKVATMVAGLNERKDELLGKVVEQRYNLMKNAERPVTTSGSGGDIAKRVREIMDKNKNPEFTVADAQRQAFAEAGKDVAPGAGAMRSTVAPPKPAAGQDKAKVAEEARQSILHNVRELQELNEQAGLTGLWRPKAEARATQLQTLIALDYNRAHGINRIGAEAEQHRLEQRVVPNLVSSGSPGARAEKLRGLEEEFAKPSGGSGESTEDEDKPEKD